MKFKDPETGVIYANILSAHSDYCKGRHCEKCPIGDRAIECYCFEFAENNPIKAARMMGYETIEGYVLDWKNITKDIGVWCKTKQEAEVLMEEANSRGFKWYSGMPANSRTYWERYAEDTVYSGFDGYGITYNKKDLFDQRVTPFSDLLLAEKQTNYNENSGCCTVHEQGERVMKFKDPKTGTVYASMSDASAAYCHGRHCNECGLGEVAGNNDCYEYAREYHVDAAKAMEYEMIVEDAHEKENKVEAENNPRICEILGVEPNKEFKVSGLPDCRFFVTKEGKVYFFLISNSSSGSKLIDSNLLFSIINYPDKIIRFPSFSKNELVVLDSLYESGARWIARGDKHLRWYTKEPYKREEDGKWDMNNNWQTGSGKLPHSLFPSILPGEKYSLEVMLDK